VSLMKRRINVTAMEPETDGAAVGDSERDALT
jgi:hypothetical protein